MNESTRLSIIQVYTPTSAASEQELDSFYQLVEKTFYEEKEYYTIIMGDWNAKLGTDTAPCANVGKYRVGCTNVSGERLLNFLVNTNTKLNETFFKKRESRRWAWQSPDGLTRNEIDHLLINDLRIVQNVEILTAFCFPSDHRLVRCTVKIPKRARYINNINKERKASLVIPVDKRSEANKQISRIIDSSRFS